MSTAELNPIQQGKIEVGGTVEIQRAIKHVHRPGNVVELRVPNAGRSRTVSGYYDDFDALTRDISMLDGKHFPGVYWTLNPVNPALLARSSNKLKAYVTNTTTDADISIRRLLPVDVDPKRPAGISSSDAEHQAALDLARDIREELRASGWPDPISADSGNGAHLLYRIDLPNNPAATDLVKRILQALAARFDNALVTVDTTTFNASRILKAYGSRARKGDNTIDRPHRQSRIIEAPEEALVVPESLLMRLADMAPVAAPAKPVYTMPPRSSGSAFDVEKFLERHGVQHRSPVPYNGGRKFVLEQCAFDPSHRAPDAAVFEAASGQLGYRCLHNSCEGRGWRDFRAHLEASHPHKDPLADFPPAPSSADSNSDGNNKSVRVESVGPSVFENMAPYPAPLGEDAYYGITRRFVDLVERHTEADPSFMAIQFLAWAGNVFGRNAFVWAGADRHYPNIFLCGVGPTSSGRKGSAAGPVQLFFQGIDEEWTKSIQSGLSSGEGLIWCVRDPIYRREKVSQGKGRPAQYEDVLVDSGVEDKRLLVQQSEFFGALQVMRRQGNTLSPVIRDAFDKGRLNSMVKNNAASATGAHITIVGNITKEELLRAMLVDEMDNGFANRFLWSCSRRSKCLPEGGRMWETLQGEPFRELQRDFNRIHYQVGEGPLRRDGEASDIWGYDDKPDVGVYRELTKERHGMYGACTARAAAITLRVSLIYALLDGADEIRKQHLIAALEVWRYCDDSAKYIFGDALGDPTADEILRSLRAAPNGMARTEISALFDRHKSANELTRALHVLHSRGMVRFEQKKTRGRPIERWFAVWQAAEKPQKT